MKNVVTVSSLLQEITEIVVRECGSAKDVMWSQRRMSTAEIAVVRRLINVLLDRAQQSAVVAEQSRSVGA